MKSRLMKAYRRKTEVVWHGKRMAVKRITFLNSTKRPSFDVWEYDIWQDRWRLNAQGFGSLEGALIPAMNRDAEIAEMLAKNKNEPKPLGNVVP